MANTSNDHTFVCGACGNRHDDDFCRLCLVESREDRITACNEAVTRAVGHMVKNAGFSSHQVKAISALFTAMIESHEETWGKR